MHKRKNDEWLIIEDSDEVSITRKRRQLFMLLVGAISITAVILVSILIRTSPGDRFTRSDEMYPVHIQPVQERNQAEPFSIVLETVLVPFDKIEPTYTKNTYSGEVTLQIFGSGQAGGKDYSDAFYLYKSGDGNPIRPPHLQEFDLELDGQRAIETLGLLQNPPPYSPEHVYEVQYNVGSEPRPIAFRISDSVVDDNNGQFIILILGAS